MSQRAVILDFRTHLKLLADHFEKKEFDSTSASAYLLTVPNGGLTYPEWERRVRTKLESNALAELKHMRLLDRRKVKRQITDQTGSRYYAGRQYLYHITTQGWKYLQYQANPDRVTTRDSKHFDDTLMLALIQKEIPMDKRDLAWEMWRFLDGARRPGNGRFPSGTDGMVTSLAKYLHDKKLKELTDSKEELTSSEGTLRANLEFAEKEIVTLTGQLKETIEIARKAVRFGGEQADARKADRVAQEKELAQFLRMFDQFGKDFNELMTAALELKMKVDNSPEELAKRLRERGYTVTPPADLIAQLEGEVKGLKERNAELEKRAKHAESRSKWGWIAAIIVGVIALIVIVYLYFKREKHKPSDEPTNPSDARQPWFGSKFRPMT